MRLGRHLFGASEATVMLMTMAASLIALATARAVARTRTSFAALATKPGLALAASRGA